MSTISWKPFCNFLEFCLKFSPWQQILQALTRANKKGLRFYRKQDIPVEYHIKENARTAPILLVADKGYFLRGVRMGLKVQSLDNTNSFLLLFQFSQQGRTKPVWDVIYSGHHGYDPYNTKEMRTIMYARGPGLKKGFTSKPLMMTDHYNLMCHLLDIEAQPNNGSWLRVAPFLYDEQGSPSNNRHRRNSSFTTLSSVHNVFLSILICIYLTFWRK